MLSNLAALTLDKKLTEYANKNGFVYTRYADDITLSASVIRSGVPIENIKHSIIKIIRECKFKENERKTRIIRPGGKKLVLGLLVDGTYPRISKETYKRIDRHLHAVLKYGLESVAKHEKFNSAYGFYNHLNGLISFVKDVDEIRWREFKKKFLEIPVPW
jgi:RNA-directed DNA polymerase